MLKVAIASLFVYLMLRDGIVDGNIVYATLFALLALEYIVELLDKRSSKQRTGS